MIDAGEPCIQNLTDLTNSIIFENGIPADWEDSFIINLYKGKGDALERGNYYGLKLLDQCLRVVERIVESIIRDRITIYDIPYYTSLRRHLIKEN